MIGCLRYTGHAPRYTVHERAFCISSQLFFFVSWRGSDLIWDGCLLSVFFFGGDSLLLLVWNKAHLGCVCVSHCEKNGARVTPIYPFANVSVMRLSALYRGDFQGHLRRFFFFSIFPASLSQQHVALLQATAKNNKKKIVTTHQLNQKSHHSM